MTLHTLLKFITLLALTMSSIAAMSGPHNHDKHNHQQAHVHGITELQLVMGVDQIEFQLASPASNIVGFEYAAKTEDEKKRVLDAKAILSNPASLFNINGIRCKTVTSLVNVHGLLSAHHERNKQNTHTEITANYQLSCPSVETVKSIEFRIFSHFPSISQLKVQWVSETEQGQRVLKKSNNRLVFGD